MLTSKTVQEFLDETASNSPAPGGGSASALAASLGMALISMVCRLTIGKKKYVDVQAEMEEILKQSEFLRSRCTATVDEDTLAFNEVMAAYGLPKDSNEQKHNRATAILQATKTATIVPLGLMELCLEGMELAQRVAERGNTNSVSDAGVAALMLHAACSGAELNVKINLKSIDDMRFVEDISGKMSVISRKVDAIAQSAKTHVLKSV